MTTRCHWLMLFVCLVVPGGIIPVVRGADRGLGDIKVIRILPRTEDEIVQAYDRARGNACEVVSADEPLEISGFMPCLTDRDRRDLERGVLLMPSSRRHMFSIGLDMMRDDASRLPTVSGSQILRYLQTHYVTIQARVRKDPVTSVLYLHHRPLAATGMFGRVGLTQEFTEATLTAVRDFHSLGVLLSGSDSPRPENLRTLVLIYRSVAISSTDSQGKPKLKPNFEYVFIRAREANGPLSLHAFATSGQRRRLHYLQPWSTPRLPDQCGVHAQVIFTEYSTLGLIPTKSATRNVTYDTQREFAWDELDLIARERGWRGDAIDNLQLALDLIIDGKVAIRETGGP